jgi:hypothetical protein
MSINVAFRPVVSCPQVIVVATVAGAISPLSGVVLVIVGQADASR